MSSTTTDRRLGLTGSAAIKTPCRVSTTGNITLSGLQTVDGVLVVTGNRVLVRAQTDEKENGVYDVDTGAWTRAKDFDGANDVVTGTIVMVLNGSTNSNTYWRLSTTGTIAFGTSAITFAAALAGDSALVSFTQSGSGATAETLQDVVRAIGKTPQQFGAVADGSTDDTAAVQAAITAAGAGYVYFPPGTYKITSTLTVSTSGAHLVGHGRSAVKLKFAPTANDVLLSFTAGASMLRNWSLRNLTLYSEDSAWTKTALEIIDGGEYEVDNVEIAGNVVVGTTNYWSGSNSIGIHVKGREAGVFNNVWSAADRPLLIGVNPNNAIDIDHHNFHNWQGIANGHPVVEISGGVDLSNVSFTGYQAWVVGTHGLYWVDTTTTVISNNLSIENVRREQVDNATDDLIHIEHNTELQGLKISNCYGDPDSDAFYLRKVTDVSLDTFIYPGTGVALNADSTVKRIRGQACFWQASSTAILVGQRLVWGAPKNPSTGALPPDFYYDESANTVRGVTVGGSVSERDFTVLLDADAELAPASAAGVIFIVTDYSVSAIYMLNGGNNSVNEISDPAGQFTVTKDNASTHNIYWDAGNSRYSIQNKLNASTTYRIFLIGNYVDF